MGWRRDRFFRLAVELSLLLHLLLLLIPQRLVPLRPLVASPAPASAQEQKPLRFELVELPEQKEETPSRADAPVSDLSRRAHGGSGERADKPQAVGTSPELRLAPSSQPSLNQPSASPSEPSPNQAPPQPATALPAEGPEAGSSLARPPQPPASPAKPTLKGLSPFSAPQLGVQVDRRGGQVDLGPLSFDTQWYDWGPYAAEMLRRIRYHWRIPELAQLGVPGVVRIRFYIEKDGRVSGLTILKDSSHPPMDFAARDAILNASPLPPLPPEVGVDREGVIITFYYNVRPPEES